MMKRISTTNISDGVAVTRDYVTNVIGDAYYTSTIEDAAPHGVFGRTMPKTTAAMRKGRLMTGERLQAINEAARRGEQTGRVKDRTANPLAVEMQRRNEATRDR